MESRQGVRMVSRVGQRLALYAGSAGKAILAFLTEEQLNHPQFQQYESIHSQTRLLISPHCAANWKKSSSKAILSAMESGF